MTRIYRHIFLFILLSSLPFHMFGQEIVGHIVDVEGHPLLGVNVSIPKISVGTITDYKGNYTLKATKTGNYAIHISFIGFKTQELKINVAAGVNHLDATLRAAENYLGEITVRDKHVEQKKKHASVAIETVTDEYIRENIGNSLLQSLEKIAGVNSMDIGAGFSKPVLRGLSFNRVSVVESGIPQAGQEWGADHGLEIDQMNIEKVEVYKGPASLLYGSDAIGGVLVIGAPIAPKKDKLEINASGVYKSNNQLWGQSAYVGWRKGNFFVRARTSNNWFGDYKVPADRFYYNSWWLPIHDSKLKNTAGREQNFSTSLGWLGKWGKSSISVSNVFQKMGFFPGSHGIPSRESLEPDGDTRNVSLPYQQVNHLKILSNTQIFSNNNSWFIDLAYQRNARSEYSNPHTHGYEKMPDNNLELEFVLHTFTAKLKQSITSAHYQLKIDYGWSAEHRNNQIDGYSFLIPAYQRTSTGAFAYANAHLSEKLIANAGIRYDFGFYSIQEYQDQYIDKLFPLSTSSQDKYRFRSTNMEQRFHDASFGLGLSYFITSAWNIKLNVGKSFRMPNVNELSANGVHHGSFRFERGDKDLQSESAYQADLVLAYQKPKLEIQLAPYINYFDNYIYLQPSGSFSDMPHAGQIYQFMQNPALRWGGELSASAALSSALRFTLAAEYIYAYNLQTQYALPMTPAPNASIGLEYSFAKLNKRIPKLKVGLDYKMVASQNETTVNEKPTDGYNLLHARASSTILLGKTSAQISVQVRNIFNTKYLNHLSFYRLIEIPEPGRNVVVSLQIPLNFDL